MATRTQLQLEPLSGCIHEQFLQSEYERQRRRIYTLCRWMLSDAGKARQMEMRIFLEAYRGASTESGLAEEIMDGDQLVAAFARQFRPLFRPPSAPHQQNRPAPDAASTPPPSATRLREAVRHLPAPQRLLYLLHELEGCAPHRLGAWLDLPPQDCSRLIHQARRQLCNAVAA